LNGNACATTQDSTTDSNNACGTVGDARLVVAVTGAMKPERFKDSDAPVNIGMALGALSALSDASVHDGGMNMLGGGGGHRGVFVCICMNGVVLPVSRRGSVVRDEESGRFMQVPSNVS
jgi:hypothetical protein